MHFRWPNLVSFKVIRGMYWTPIIVAYLPPSTLDHLPDIDESFECFRVQDPILMEDLNEDLDEARNLCSQLVTNILTAFGLINLMHHFRQSCCFFHIKTWTQFRQGTMLSARCNYILGTYKRLFELVDIRDMSNYSSYHFALQVRLLQRLKRCHSCYLQGRCSFPLCLPVAADLSMSETNSQALKALNTPPDPSYATPYPPVDVIDQHKSY